MILQYSAKTSYTESVQLSWSASIIRNGNQHSPDRILPTNERILGSGLLEGDPVLTCSIRSKFQVSSPRSPDNTRQSTAHCRDTERESGIQKNHDSSIVRPLLLVTDARPTSSQIHSSLHKKKSRSKFKYKPTFLYLDEPQ